MRVLLVEDSLRLQSALQTGFRRAGIALDVVGDGRTGLARASVDPYDVVVLDLLLPELDGLSVLRELRARGSAVHVLILTARDGVDDRVRGLQMGADDYLVKPFEFAELVARVRALARREYRLKRTVVEFGDVTIDLTASKVLVRDAEVPLTRREYALIEYLAYRRGEPVSRIEIEDHLYRGQDLPSSNAVDSAICALRRKLAAVTPEPLIHTRRGLGYVLESRS